MDDPSRTVRLASNVLKALPCPDPAVMALASRVFARLTATGGLLMLAPATNQLKTLIEWLQGERIEQRRWAAVLLLREMAKAVPNVVYDHMSVLLDNIWTALRDPKIAIREAASTAMGYTLDIAYGRDGPLRGDWYLLVYEQATKGLKAGPVEVTHGSLLAIKELLLNTGHVRECEEYAHS